MIRLAGTSLSLGDAGPAFAKTATSRSERCTPAGSLPSNHEPAFAKLDRQTFGARNYPLLVSICRIPKRSLGRGARDGILVCPMFQILPITGPLRPNGPTRQICSTPGPGQLRPYAVHRRESFRLRPRNPPELALAVRVSSRSQPSGPVRPRFASRVAAGTLPRGRSASHPVEDTA
jgi:hypothetical protein